MNAGLNLLTALFLLAPGFGAFAGVYLTSLRRPFRPAPAAPSSLLALALITIGALVTHGLSSLPYAASELWCGAGFPCHSVGFEPNPYVTLIDPHAAVDQPGLSLSIALVHLVLVAALGLVVGWAGIGLAARFKGFQTLFYGWTTELTDRAPTRFHVINAFAVTDIANDENSLGYEGTLLDLRQDAGGKLLSATLRDVQAFVLILKDGKVARQKVAREAPIPFMVLEAENVKNLALSVYFDIKTASALPQTTIDAMTEAEREALRMAMKEAVSVSTNSPTSEIPTAAPADVAPEPSKSAAASPPAEDQSAKPAAESATPVEESDTKPATATKRPRTASSERATAIRPPKQPARPKS